MADESLDFGILDLLSVIFGGVGAAIGVSFPFLPSTLPEPFSLAALAGIAVLLTTISILLQAVSIGETNDGNEQEEVTIPIDVYNSHLSSSHEAGLQKGRLMGFKEGLREGMRNETTEDQQYNRIISEQFGSSPNDHRLDEYTKSSEEEHMESDELDEEDTDTGDKEQEQEREYSAEVKERVNELENRIRNDSVEECEREQGEKVFEYE